MNKKIFVNALSAKLGGSKTYLVNLFLNLNDLDVTVYVVCPDKSVVPLDDRIVFIESRFANKNILFRLFWEVFYLPFLLLRLKVDLLFVPGGMDFTLFKFGIRKVTMFRNMLPFDSEALKHVTSTRLKLKNFILKYLMIRSMNSSQHLIFISEYAKKSIMEYINVKSTDVIYHGIAPEFKPKDMLRDDYILYVSRFEPYKNHLNLIKAYSLLPSNIKNKHQLWLVGEYMEPEITVCRKFVDDNDLNENIIFLGKINYSLLPELYQKCKVFVFPSSCENCPNILLEALGCCAPIISAEVEPMPEFAKKASLYFNAERPDSIHDVLLEVLINDSLQAKLSNESNNIRNQYLWSITAESTWNTLTK